MSSLAGSTLGHFAILEKLGTGGMGEVYRARDRTLGREVAIKILPPRFAADERRLARFTQEARSASALNHPSIVTVHEVGHDGDVRYIVMELVEGTTLRRQMTGRPFSTRKALDVGVQVAQGLAAAHAAGIVHRDLKPDNLMVRSDGFVKILDFGLAKLRGMGDDSDSDAGGRPLDPQVDTRESTPTDLAATEAGTILGTAGYMSPEQASGTRVDFRADQFSFGVILYEMLAGQRAFKRESPVQTLAAIIESEPEPLAALNPGLPAPLVWIVERCLSKDPPHRYASTIDLVRELEKVRAHLDELSGATTGPRPPLGGRRPVGILAIAAVLAALLSWPEVRTRILEALLGLPVPTEKHVVVLPFATPTADPLEKAFADGIVETLAGKLTELERFQPSFWIVPMADVRQLGVASAGEARHTFGANLVVTGSLRRTGEKVRLTANLVDAATLQQIREIKPIDAPMDDVAALQDGFVEQVVAMLDVPIRRHALAGGDTRAGGAYTLYVEGRGRLQQYENPASLDQAIALFQRALEQDPHYPHAYAGLGEAYWRKYRLTRDASLVDLARSACQEALKLNELMAPVYVTLGIVEGGTGRYEEAEAALKRALALDPQSSDALREMARLDASQGRKEEAEAVYRKAIALKPGYWAGYNLLGVFYLNGGRLLDAEAQFKRVVALSPGNTRGYNNLAAVYQRLGRYDEAEDQLRRSLAARKNAVAYSSLGAIQFFRGRYTEAARSLEGALDLAGGDYRIWRNLAAAYYWAPGEREKARAAYEKAASLAEAELVVNPRDAGLLVRIADAYAMLDRAKPARETAARAVALAPKNPEVLFLAGTVAERLGDRNSALEWVGKALDLGYSRVEAEGRPDLVDLRKDPRFGKRMSSR